MSRRGPTAPWMSQCITSDVRSHLSDLDPDFPLENLINHLADVNGVRSYLPDIKIPDQARGKIDLLRSKHVPTEHFDLHTHWLRAKCSTAWLAQRLRTARMRR